MIKTKKEKHSCYSNCTLLNNKESNKTDFIYKNKALIILAKFSIYKEKQVVFALYLVPFQVSF